MQNLFTFIVFPFQSASLRGEEAVSNKPSEGDKTIVHHFACVWPSLSGQLGFTFSILGWPLQQLHFTQQTEKQPTGTSNQAPGARMFTQYCAVCHGAGGNDAKIGLAGRIFGATGRNSVPPENYSSGTISQARCGSEHSSGKKRPHQ
jgi:hypothetical protein